VGGGEGGGCGVRAGLGFSWVWGLRFGVCVSSIQGEDGVVELG